MRLAGCETFVISNPPPNLRTGRGGREKKLPRDLTVEMLEAVLTLPDEGEITRVVEVAP